jgi:hypothetical protein
MGRPPAGFLSDGEVSFPPVRAGFWRGHRGAFATIRPRVDEVEGQFAPRATSVLGDRFEHRLRGGRGGRGRRYLTRRSSASPAAGRDQRQESQRRGDVRRSSHPSTNPEAPPSIRWRGRAADPEVSFFAGDEVEDIARRANEAVGADIA